MLGVVEEGSGKSAQVEGYAIGGRARYCGETASKPRKELKFFHWICPQESAEVMIYVVVDEPNLAQQAATYSGDKTFCGHYERSISIFEYYKIGINKNLTEELISYINHFCEVFMKK